ncbi:MAG: UvrD-helicase domain-containing protein [Devosia sp.]
MENYSLVRVSAADLRKKIDPGMAEVAAETIVDRALIDRQLTLEELPAGDPTLAGALGVFIRKFGLVAVQKGLDARTRLEVIAHEIGHEVVHDGETAAVSADYGTPGPGDPVLRVEAYGLKERREAQANVFARELLLPRALARRLFQDGKRAHAIAEATGLNLTLVFQQLTDALLLPEPPRRAAPKLEQSLTLDPSQQEAADFRGQALLLEAGPGTGKTRTLVERIVGLIQSEEARPSEILALTFSNKAAGELSDRVGKSVGGSAANIWTSTFHAFGLELLRKHHKLFDLSADPTLIDGSQAIDLLEDTLPALPIVHNQNLFEPALALREILRAISRAKDELVDWPTYTALADEMAASADPADTDAVLAAAKAQEVALVYRHYQERLLAERAVDYGDLVMLTAIKTRDDEGLRTALQQQFKWIHVDEYQDINRASAMLVKGIAGNGERLWVVGDARQSIYRFRGASIQNMARFGRDYPHHERKALKVNYRSTQQIIDTFSRFSETMAVSSFSLPLKLTPNQKSPGQMPSVAVGSDPDDEYSALAASIRDLQSAGIPLNDQAVLARSNATLARVGEELEARGVPVLYLGPLFDRPEVRDLLSLLSLIANAGSTLLRVGTFDQYRVGVGDTKKLIDAAKALDVRASTMLSRLNEVEGLSDRGRAALGLLAQHLEGFHFGTTPWLALMEYLFERSNYMAGLLKGERPSDDMRRVAVRQLVEALRSMPLSGNQSPIGRGLRRIRHMVLLADERELRRLPDELSDIEGVHLFTIHASKGLEFGAVHLPGLKKGAVPAPNRPDRCPPPVGLIKDAVETDAHAAEEECLFFVGMSRAQSALRFYRPASAANGNHANPSIYLDRLSLASLSIDRIARHAPKPIFAPLPHPPAPALIASDLEAYDRCPRRFYYDRVLGLRGDAADSTYLAAHQCLMKVIAAAREAGVPLSEEQIKETFDKAWAGSGLIDHVYEKPYRVLTETMLTSLRPLLSRGLPETDVIVVRLGSKDVEVRPDQIVTTDGGVTFRTIRRGRPTTTEEDRLGNTLMLEAVRQSHGGGGRVESFHIATGAFVEIGQTPTKVRNRLQSSAAIADAIGRGDYPPEISEWECPRCRYFFMCPAPLEDVAT